MTTYCNMDEQNWLNIYIQIDTYKLTYSFTGSNANEI